MNFCHSQVIFQNKQTPFTGVWGPLRERTSSSLRHCSMSTTFSSCRCCPRRGMTTSSTCPLYPFPPGRSRVPVHVPVDFWGPLTFITLQGVNWWSSVSVTTGPQVEGIGARTLESWSTKMTLFYLIPFIYSPDLCLSLLFSSTPTRFFMSILLLQPLFSFLIFGYHLLSIILMLYECVSL